MEVRCLRGPGAGTSITPQGCRTPNWPVPTCNPATSLPHSTPTDAPFTLKPGGSVEEKQLKMAQRKKTRGRKQGEGREGTLKKWYTLNLMLHYNTMQVHVVAHACSEPEYRWTRVAQTSQQPYKRYRNATNINGG